MINNGLNLELEVLHQKPTDYVFGALSQPCLASIPEYERITYLPIGERQNIGDEKMDCATRGPTNIYETKFTYLYQNNKLLPENKKFLEDKGYVVGNRVLFSDRFNAIKSGTTRQGNSIIAPLDSIHRNGLIPKYLLPQVNSWDEYYSGITKDMELLGQDFLSRFDLKYERVYEIHYNEVLKDDLINMAGFAWTTPVDGEYPSPGKTPPNHVFIGFARPLFTVFDNYLDTDGDFVKKLASDYDLFEYGYRAYISKEYNEEERKQRFRKVPWIFALLKSALESLAKLLAPKTEIPKEIPMEPVKEEPKPNVLKWDTPENVRHSIRVIGDEFNLPVIWKDLLCDIAKCESGFKPNARLENSPKSIDRGLFQWNSYWHPQITDEIAYDPEKNTRLACQALLEGKAVTYWNASKHCWNKGGKYDSIL